MSPHFPKTKPAKMLAFLLLKGIIMRKIEQAMVNAIARHENFSKGNTTAIRLKNGVTQVFLHGNHIANVYDDVEVNMGTFRKYPTATTRSRLNALFITFDSGKRARIQKGIPFIEKV